MCVECVLRGRSFLFFVLALFSSSSHQWVILYNFASPKTVLIIIVLLCIGMISLTNYALNQGILLVRVDVLRLKINSERQHAEVLVTRKGISQR